MLSETTLCCVMWTDVVCLFHTWSMSTCCTTDRVSQRPAAAAAGVGFGTSPRKFPPDIFSKLRLLKPEKHTNPISDLNLNPK